MAKKEKKGLLLDSVGFRNQNLHVAGDTVTAFGLLAACIGIFITAFSSTWFDSPEELEEFLKTSAPKQND